MSVCQGRVKAMSVQDTDQRWHVAMVRENAPGEIVCECHNHHGATAVDKEAGAAFHGCEQLFLGQIPDDGQHHYSIVWEEDNTTTARVLYGFLQKKLKSSP